ncbi:MAG: class I SAM-dependent methyltransferase [Burkholderiales bacterium]|nr:class I SAM-dependent methyltransferase [Burkholderiales bacterium]
MPETNHYLKSYARRNYKKVNGWLGSDTISQLIQIDGIQRKLGLSGHVGEIGVHHGKLFILLYLLAQQGEHAIAVDIFEQQALNVDKSGKGSLQVLERNLEAFTGGKSKLRVINADSTTIGAEQITAATGGYLRLFSIDGGHQSHIVRHDLNTAASAICEGGVIILDDYFNPEFPGVSECVNQFFLMDNTQGLVPFFVAMNKIYLTTQGYAERYMDHFTRTDIGIPFEATTKFLAYNTSLSPIRITEMFGTNVISYSPDRFGSVYKAGRTIRKLRSNLRRNLSNSAAWQYLRTIGLARLVRRLADKIIPY